MRITNQAGNGPIGITVPVGLSIKETTSSVKPMNKSMTAKESKWHQVYANASAIHSVSIPLEKVF